MHDDSLKGRLKRRETWPILIGTALPILTMLAEVVSHFTGNPSFLHSMNDAVAIVPVLTATLLGTGAAAQIKRGQQRGEEVAKGLRQAAAPFYTATSNTQGTPAAKPVPSAKPAPAPSDDGGAASLHVED